ncbi:extensin-like [Solanum verrucosum]|uniref:extensin-like n=1 Tax=Solanum verrucosum TaxID=315347 RepID=UPI0020D078B1|nr:extensin-like [Solanum verrucosum]
MKTVLILLVLLVLSRIESNEATRNLDTHLLLPSLHTRPPVKTPAPDPGTEANVNMASKFNERNYFVGRKEVVVSPPSPTNAYPLDKTHLLLPSLQTRSPVETPSPNPGIETKVVFAPPPPTNAYPLDKTHFLLPSLQTRPPVKTPSPNPGSETSVNMASTVTERNFVGRKEVVFAPPPPTNAYPLDKTHLLLPSLQTRPPVKTPSPNPGKVGFAPPSLQKNPVPTPTPNPGTGARTTSVMSQITERNFAGHKETETRPPPLPSSSNTTQHKVTDKAVGLLAAH